MQTKNFQKIFTAIFIAVLMLACVGLPAQAADSIVAKARMNTARSGLAAAQVNGKVYAVGGYNGSYLALTQEFDPANNTWKNKASMPTARQGAVAAAVNGKIYVIGGYNGSFLNTVEVYDPAKDSWETRTSMPTARQNAGVAVAGGKIYVFGGGCDGNNLKKAEVYDPATDTWKVIADMPTARNHTGAGTVNGKIYVVGGYSSGNYSGALEEYDSESDSWTTKTPMPGGRIRHSVEAFGGKIYVMGGYNGSYLSDIQEYNPVTGKWLPKTGPMTARCGTGTAIVNDKIYILGGENGSYLDVAEEYTPVEDTWTKMAPMPTARHVLSAEGINGKVYVVGGYLSGSRGELEVFDPASNTWTTRAGMPTPRHGIVTATVGGKIYVIGGHYSGARQEVEEYDYISNTWKSKTVMPTARFYSSAATVDGKVYVFGGNNGSALKTTEVYDVAADKWSTRTVDPTARYHAAAAAVNGKIYVIGGTNGSSNLNTVEEYNPITDAWTVKKSMSTARHGMAAVADNGKIYAIGGYNGSQYIDLVEEYDPETDTWVTRGRMPTARGYLAAAVALDRIYAVGGHTSSPLNTMEEYVLPSSILAVPQNLTAAVSGSNITLTWDPVPSATGYDVEVDGKVLDNGASIRYTLVNSTSGVQHTFRVRAKNADYESSWSDTVTMPDKPLAPQNIRASAVGDTVTLTWDASLGAEGYDVEEDGQVVNNGAVTVYQHSGLALGSKHLYRVRAKNSLGISDWSSTLTVTLTASGNETGIKGEYFDNIDFTGAKFTRTDANINFDWGQNAPNISIEPDTFSVRWTGQIQPRYSEEYTFYTYTDDGVTLWVNGQMIIESWNDQNAEKSGKITLEAGKKYDIKMEYYDNTLGATARLMWKSATQPKEVIPQDRLFPTYSGLFDVNNNGLTAEYYNNPDFTNLALTRKDATVNFSWELNAPDPSMDEDTFSVRWTGKIQPKYSEKYTFYTLTDDGVRLWVDGKLIIDKWIDQYGENKGTITLEAGKKYDFKMEYYDNLYGATAKLMWESSSQPKQIIQQSCLYSPGLDIPQNVSAKAGNTSVEVTWSAVEGASAYEVEADGLTVNNGAGNTYVHTGLTPKTRHTYRVRAKNTDNSSEWSQSIEVTTLSGIPAVPANVTASAQETQVAINWDKVTDATSYELMADGRSISVTDAVYVHSGLLPGTRHSYKVRSVNGYGSSEWSSEMTASTILNIPGTPSQISTRAQQTQITVNWDQVAYATSYDLMADGRLISVTGAVYAHNGLLPGTQHSYRVRAVNAAGSSAWSTQVVVSTLPGTAPQVPANICVVAGESGFTVVWDQSPDADFYELMVDGSLVSVTDAVYKHNTLKPAASHTYRVRAGNRYGISGWSQTINTSELPAAPENVSAVSTAAGIQISWKEVPDAATYEIEIDGTLINNGSAAVYIHADAASRTGHSYRIRAVNAVGKGSWSKMITFTPQV